MVNNLSIFGILLYSILGVGAIYLILSNKRSLLSTLIKTIETYRENKLVNSFLLMILPTLLILLPISIKLAIYRLIQYNELSTLLAILSLMSFIFNIVLIGCFTFDSSKSHRENKYKIIALNGYISIQFIFLCVNIISTVALAIFKTSNFIAPLTIASSLIMIAILTFAMEKVKIKVNKRDKLLIGITVIGVMIINQIFLSELISSNIPVSLFVNSNLIFIMNFLRYSLVLIPFVYCLYSLRNNFNNNKKLLRIKR